MQRKRTTKERNDTLAALINLQKEALAETIRHNRRMEQLQEQELELKERDLELKKREVDLMEERWKRERVMLEQKWEHENKMAELKLQGKERSYERSLVDGYKKVKRTLSNEKMREVFPEFAHFIDMDECSKNKE